MTGRLTGRGRRVSWRAEPDGGRRDRRLGRSTYSAIQVVFRPVYLSSACNDRSRPKPDCLNPPNGVCALRASTVLTDTVPARSAAATRWARERSLVHTEAANP